MFDLFKKDIVVKCYNLEELAKLLDWYRAQYLNKMADTQFPVTAVTNGIFSAYENGPQVLYFEVSIPYIIFKKMKDEFIEKECFDPVLEQRAMAKLLGRDI